MKETVGGGTTRADIARSLAAEIKSQLAARVNNRISHATLATSLSLHIALEAIATTLEVDKTWFKQECGVGQPLAYFI